MMLGDPDESGRRRPVSSGEYFDFPCDNLVIATGTSYSEDVVDTTKGIDKEIYMAVISLALKEYLEDVHDIEPGIITIKPKQTRWNEPRFNNK